MISVFHLYFYFFYKKLKTAKNTFSSFLNDPDFSRVIRPCTVTQFTILYHPAKNLRKLMSGSMLIFGYTLLFGAVTQLKLRTEVENCNVFDLLHFSGAYSQDVSWFITKSYDTFCPRIFKKFGRLIEGDE